MDIIKSLESLKKVELKLQDLYEFYNKKFLDDKEAAALFLDLSLEEKSHAGLIDYQLRIIRKNRPMFKDVDFDTDQVNQFVAEVDDHISSKEPISLEDALKFGIETENNAIERQYRILIRESHPELAELVNKLGISDRAHIDSLRVLAETRGYSDK